MFFLTYLRRELRRRMRQATLIALGLALGIGLVITVSATSAGVKAAEASVLKSLYGVGTDLTVSKAAAPPGPTSSGRPPPGAITFGPQGACEFTAQDQCKNVAGQTVDLLRTPALSTLSTASVAAVAKLHDVTSAAGGLLLNDTRQHFPKASPGSSAAGPGAFPGGLQPPTAVSVDGVDLRHPSVGPLAAGTPSAGRSFTAADATADVAILDSNYATANKLIVGSTVTIASTPFTAIGIVRQPQGSNPPDVYLPLARAQALATNDDGKALTGQVDTIYVSAASAADIPAVQQEISRLLPSATVTSSASLASQVTGSVASTAKLASNLGRWLAILVLIAAFAVASLLTLAAVARRIPEFGTLKALGWRSRRIIGQVMGESVVIGIVGGIGGVALGYGGAAVITALAPKLTATIPNTPGAPAGPGLTIVRNGVAQHLGPSSTHTVGVHLTAPVTPAVLWLAIGLAVIGGLLAGSFGSWRAARLRPAAALGQVA